MTDSASRIADANGANPVQLTHERSGAPGLLAGWPVGHVPKRCQIPCTCRREIATTWYRCKEARCSRRLRDQTEGAALPGRRMGEPSITD